MNLFWYRYWFNDKIFQINIQQDDIFDKIIYYYLFYGIFFPKNIFINKYWYLNKFKINIKHEIIHNEKYYRKLNFKNLTFNIIKIHKIRTKNKNMFFSKIWILKFQKWLIINFYTFQPLKKLKNSNKIKNDLNFYNYNKKNNKNSNLKRIKLFILFIFLNINNINNKNVYNF